MSGKVVGELNIPNGDTSYDAFTQSLTRSLFYVKMLQLRCDFYIVQNENIIFSSNYPYSSYFKRKLNMSDPFQCICTPLKMNTRYKDLFDLLTSHDDELSFRKAMQNLPDEYKDDDEFMSILCSFSRFKCLCDCSTRLQNDKEFCLLICEKNASAVHFVISYCSEKLRNDKSFILKLIEYNPRELPFIMSFCPKDFLNDKSFILKLIEYNPKELRFVMSGCPKDFLNDKSFISKLVEYNPNALLYADNTILADKYLLLYAIAKGGTEKIFHLLQYDQVYSIIAVILNPVLYQFAQSCITKNKKLLCHLLKKNVWLFRYADKSLRKDISIVKKVVAIDGLLLEFADKSLQNNMFIVKLAIENNGLSLKFADESFQKNDDIVKRAVANNGYSLEFADKSLQKDKSIVRIAITHSGRSLEFADKLLQDDESIVKIAVTNNGLALESANHRFRSNIAIALIAVMQSPYAFKLIDDSIKFRKEFYKASENYYKVTMRDQNTLRNYRNTEIIMSFIDDY